MVAEAQVPVMVDGEGWFGHVAKFRGDPLSLVVRGLRNGDDLVRLRVAMVQAYVVYGPEIVVQDLDAAAWMCVTVVDAVVHAAVMDRKRLDDPVVEQELSAMLLRYLTGGRASGARTGTA